MRRTDGPRARPRKGVALVAALGLLVLAAALLAASAVASAGLHRATRGVTAVARAEWEGRRVLGDAMVDWGGGADSLPVGAWLDRPLPTADAAGPPLVARARVQRLTGSVFSLTALVQVGESPSALAYRHIRLLLERAPSEDSAAGPSGPVPIARWSVIDVP